MRFKPEDLELFIRSIFDAAGVQAEAAREVARHLVKSSVAGHNSHGVNRLPQYVMQLDQGNVNPNAVPSILVEKPGMLLVDGQQGFGHYTLKFALDAAFPKARSSGACVGTVRHATHIGRLGEFCEYASEQGLVSLVTTGAAGLDLGWMFLPGTNRRFVGANPWAMGFPTPDAPIIYDASMTNVAQGKVHVAQTRGEPIPKGWVTDARGAESTDPQALYEGGALTPLGGAIAGHKGFSLGLVAALLGGLSMIDDADPTPVAANVQVSGRHVEANSAEHPWLAGVFFMLIDPDAFGGAASYGKSIAALQQSAHGAKGIPPEAILFPGEFESRERQRNLTEGLDVPASVIDEFAELGKRFNRPLPQALA